MCDSTQGSLCPSPMKNIKYVDTVTFFAKTWSKGHWPLGNFDPTSVEVTCVTLPKDHCVQVPWKYIKVCGYSDPFAKTWTQRSVTLDDLWPRICWGLMCDSTQGSLCPSPWNTSKYVDTMTFFAKKNLNQRSLTPRWPLTPHLLRSHVWLYPRIIVSKSHENTSKYVDTVNLFAKLEPKVIDPRWPLTPHLWGHRCDSTQGSLYPSPMGIHQCMWIQWWFCKLPHTYIHTHTTYILRTYYVQY